MTTMTEATTHTLDVPGATLTYDVRTGSSPTPCPAAHRLADGGRRIRHARRAFRRPHRRDLRPAGRGTQREGRSGQPVHARAARRRPASDHRRARRRSGRSLRQQRWRGERARAGGQAPGAGSDARRARTAARLRSCPIAREPWRSPRRSMTPTSAAGSVPAWRTSSWPSATRDRSPRSSPRSRVRTRPCSACPPRTTARRTDALLGQNIITCTHYEPDFEALRAASTRIVLAAGAESEGEMAHRGAEAVAERLGTKPVIFPSDHGGFLGGEYGQTGDPDGFAAKLREVLAQS